MVLLLQLTALSISEWVQDLIKHVVGIDAVISLLSSSCPIVVKQCSFYFGAMNEAEVLDAV